MQKIPKVINFFWNKSSLSYLQFLTIVSFHKFNPDWEIVVHECSKPFESLTWVTDEQKIKYTGKDYYPILKSLSYVKFNEINFKKIGFSEEVSDVFKSDYVRWYLLATNGGVWSDMDILYFKPLSSINIPDGVETVICNNNFGNIIGFFMSSPNNEIFRKLYENATTHFDPYNYQSIGSNLINYYFGNLSTGKKVYNLNDSVFYAYNHMNINKIFNSNNLSLLTDDSVGLHWYNGSNIAKTFLNSYEEETKNNNVISLLLEKYQIKII